ncbi:MAG: ABC transporter ATP-binding protein [Thermoanaerobaculales bacterium]|jgi:iron complex transport system ATP-binding protein|nr:ABC transporter ATP-binding protein [Thermoanaerobaculales bacterium]
MGTLSGSRIEVRDLGVRLGEAEILAGVGLSVAAGELLAVIGPNGAGKSTLLRAIDGLLPVRHGSIAIDGRPVSDYRRRELARVVSFVPQSGAPADGYTVRAFVEMGRYPHLPTWSGLTSDDRRVVDEALELTETGHLAARALTTLSGGERQRVSIAAALAQGGSILLLDEPTSFLDVRHQVQVLELLGRLHRDGGYTVVAVTHDLNGLVADADSVLGLVGGRVACSARPAEVLDAEVLAGIFSSGFRLLPGGRHGLPVVVPARGER